VAPELDSPRQAKTYRQAAVPNTKMPRDVGHAAFESDFRFN